MIGDFFAIFSIAYKGVSEICHLHTNLMMSACVKISIKAEDSFCNGGCLWFRDVCFGVSVDLESVNFSFPGAPYVSIVL